MHPNNDRPDTSGETRLVTGIVSAHLSHGEHRRADGPDRTIAAYWERSEDGQSWQRDFDIRYTKARYA